MSRVESPRAYSFDGQAFQLFGPSREPLADPGPVRLPEVRNLRRRVLDGSLGALELRTPVAVSIPRTLPVAALVVRPTEPVFDLGLKQVVMDLGGWRTRSVFGRYNVTSEKDIADALERVSAYVAERREETPTVVPLTTATGTDAKNADTTRTLGAETRG